MLSTAGSYFSAAAAMLAQQPLAIKARILQIYPTGKA
jgi:hypothetical protein